MKKLKPELSRIAFLEAENATLRAVLEDLQADHRQYIRKLVALEAGLEEAFTAHDAAAHSALADLHAKIQGMWAWEHAQRQRAGGTREDPKKIENEAEAIAVYKARVLAEGKRGSQKFTASVFGVHPSVISRLLKRHKVA